MKDKKLKVVIEIHNGCAEVESASKGVTVVIKDYDLQEEGAVLDRFGKSYNQSTFKF